MIGPFLRTNSDRLIRQEIALSVAGLPSNGLVCGQPGSTTPCTETHVPDTSTGVRRIGRPMVDVATADARQDADTRNLAETPESVWQNWD